MIKIIQYDNNILRLVDNIPYPNPKNEQKVKVKKERLISFTQIFLFAIILIALQFGCKATRNTITNRPEITPSVDLAVNSVNSAKEQVSLSREELSRTTTLIEDNAEKGKTETPEEVRKLLFPRWDNILLATKSQWQLVNKLEQTEEQLVGASFQLNYAKERVLELENFAENQIIRAEKAEDQIRALKESANKQLKEKFAWISIASFAGLVLSIVLAFMGNKIAVTVAIGCAISLALSIFLIQSWAYIPWVVGGILLIAAGVTIWQIIEKKKAVEELIVTGEIAKHELGEEKRKKLFGDGALPGVVSSIQSNSTQKMVQEARQKLPNSKKNGYHNESSHTSINTIEIEARVAEARAREAEARAKEAEAMLLATPDLEMIRKNLQRLETERANIRPTLKEPIV